MALLIALAAVAIVLSSAQQHSFCFALSSPSTSRTTRRDLLITGAGALTAATTASSPLLSSPLANAAPPLPLPLRTAGSTSPVRVEEIGGGFDLLSNPSSSALASSDCFYPSSMSGSTWRVQRVVTSVEGDLGQAAIAWKCLGGGDERAFTSKLTELYNTRFIAAPDTMEDALYEFDGKTLRAAILDRKYEVASRVGTGSDSIIWDATASPGLLSYARPEGAGDPVELKVVQRKIEPPSEAGFGSDELYRIKSSAGGIFGGTGVYRAARVRRRYRRGFDESTGSRIVDGIEVVTTFRVLDGVAGVEMPTSTCKSRIRLTQL